MTTNWDKIGFVMAGKKRIKVLIRLKKGPAMPKQLSKELKIKLPNLSVTLKELETKKLIKNLTPKNRKGKIYALTTNGEQTLNTIHELTKSKKKKKKEDSYKSEK